MPRTKGSKNKPQNTLKKGMPTKPTIVYVDGNHIVGEIKKKDYTIIVTDTHAVIKSTYFTTIYGSPSVQYNYLFHLIDLDKKEDKTEEDKETVENLSILYPNIANFHLLYYTDFDLANEMVKFHYSYMNNKVEAAMNAELQSDEPDALKQVMEDFEMVEGADLEDKK